MMTIAGASFTVLQAGAGRSYQLSSSTASLGAAAAPTIAAPAAGATLGTSTHSLRWSAVSGAASYEVTLVNETTGNTDLFISVLAPATSTVFR